MNLLGLFPSFEKIGGVETSGRLAWEPFAAEPQRHQLFCYSNHGAARLHSNGHAIYAGSKAQALATAMGRRWTAQTVLVWHLGLMKLLPFLRLRNAKVALFLHGIEAWRRQGRFTRQLLRRVDLFLSNSEHTWQRFVSFHPEMKSAAHRVVHLGIGQAWSRPMLAPDHPPAVLMIGRMLVGERYKGHREMMAAWPLVLDRHPHARLWIAGPGPLGPELEREVRGRGLAHSITIYGPVTEDQKQDLLMRCRCLALPSRGEGFGLVYCEAMRMARPCLVSTIDAGREVVEPPEAGLEVDPDDLTGIAAAVSRLLTPGPEWDRWSDRARHRYELRYTAAQFQERLLAALAELAPCHS